MMMEAGDALAQPAVEGGARALTPAGDVAVVDTATSIDARRGGRTRWPGGAALIGWAVFAALALTPLLFGELYVYNAGLVVIFVIAALGLHILVNWAGELSLAHAGMVGLPALSVIALSQIHQLSPLYLLPVGVAIGAVTGLVVSLPALKAKDLQVALVTLTAGIAISRFFLQQPWLISGRGSRSAAMPAIGGLQFTTAKSLYLPLLAIFAIVLVFVWVLMHSVVGRGWRWVAANPDAASCVGIPVAAYKIAAYATAGAFAGLGGGLTVCWIRQLSPVAFPTTLNFTYLLAAVLAGSGYAGGVIVAGVVLTGSPLFFRSTSTGVNTVLSFLGPLALIFNLVYYKAGLNGGGRDVLARLRSMTRRPSAHVAIMDGRAEPPLSDRESIERPTVSANSHTGQPRLLDVEGISLAFGGVHALRQVSLSVPSGAIVGLIGPNGAGKTTLFNVISGLQRPDAGRVAFDGVDITRLRPARRARLGVGRSFQNLGLIQNETVRTNLQAALHLSAGYWAPDVLVRPWRWWRGERVIARRADQLARRVGITAILDDRVDQLSFGAARFVELACVLAEDPRLVLLDEPTTGLDVGEIDRLLEIVRWQRRAGTTALIVAHDVRFVMDICDVVYVLSAGGVLAVGDPAEVQANPEVVAAYLGEPR
jgi:branched-chain amino acid transport system permease protein